MPSCKLAMNIKHADSSSPRSASNYRSFSSHLFDHKLFIVLLMLVFKEFSNPPKLVPLNYYPQIIVTLMFNLCLAHNIMIRIKYIMYLEDGSLQV